MKTIGREILWNLPHAAAIIMYALFGVVMLVIAWGVYRRVEAYRLGRTERENRFDDLRGHGAGVAHGERAGLWALGLPLELDVLERDRRGVAEPREHGRG